MSIEQDIKILEEKVAQSRKRIEQAEKQYKNALKNLEKQKQAVQTARLDIDRVKIRIANRVALLQSMKESADKKSAQAHTYSFNVKLESMTLTPEIVMSAEPVCIVSTPKGGK